jgi:hypothetical protein
MYKFRTGVAIAALMITAPAMAGPRDCASIKEFNGKVHAAFGPVPPLPLAIAGMKHIPCHCIPVSERMDRVYRKPPPGMTCGNGWFYDKQCHEGLSCGPQ